ncbi:MAG: hypothetical protein AAFY84_16865 [Pseudomonadota bacterium]
MISEVADLFGGESGPVVKPTAVDRRLTERVLGIWAKTARGHFPSWDDLRAYDFQEDWNWIFVVDIEKSVGFPYFIYLGSQLAKLSDVYLSGQDDWTLSLLDKATNTVDLAVSGRAPHLGEDNLKLCDSRNLLFRCLCAPLADDGTTITHVLGAVSGRIDFSHAEQADSDEADPSDDNLGNGDRGSAKPTPWLSIVKS